MTPLLLILIASVLAVAQFRTSVDVALVDVTVVDSKGQPVEGLTASDFEVTVEGQRRPVVAIDYIRVAGEVSVTAEAAPAAPNSASTAKVRPRSRSVVFLLDDLSFKPQPAQSLGSTLERLLPLLGEQDLVGVTTTSGRGPTVTPTLDHSSILAALPRLAGRRDDTSAPFMIGIDEALASETRQGVADMVRRECEILALGNRCGSMVRAAARREAALVERRTEEQLTAIRETISWMKNLAEPRVLILVSDGIAGEVRHDLAEQLGRVSEAATAASVRLYALTGVADDADVSDLTFERRRARVSERRFLSRGVQTVAAAAGGESFLVIGQPDRFLRRIALETSAMYQLAVQIQPPSADDPAFLDVEVMVKRRGTTVRLKPFALRGRGAK